MRLSDQPPQQGAVSKGDQLLRDDADLQEDDIFSQLLADTDDSLDDDVNVLSSLESIGLQDLDGIGLDTLQGFKLGSGETTQSGLATDQRPEAEPKESRNPRPHQDANDPSPFGELPGDAADDPLAALIADPGACPTGNDDPLVSLLDGLGGLDDEDEKPVPAAVAVATLPQAKPKAVQQPTDPVLAILPDDPGYDLLPGPNGNGKPAESSAGRAVVVPGPGKPRSEGQLRRASEMVYYQLWMFTKLANGLAAGLVTGSVLRNALLESFAVHGGLVIDFLYADNPGPNDVSARDYFDDHDRWAEVRPCKSKTIDLFHADVKYRVSHPMARLSYSPPKPPTERASWQFIAIAKEVNAAFDKFLELVPAERLSPRWSRVRRHRQTGTNSTRT